MIAYTLGLNRFELVKIQDCSNAMNKISQLLHLSRTMFKLTLLGFASPKGFVTVMLEAPNEMSAFDVFPDVFPLSFRLSSFLGDSCDPRSIGFEAAITEV